MLLLLLAVGCGPDDRLTILHTNDWQSHMLGQGPNATYTPLTTGDDATLGGLARLRTAVDRIRDEARHPVVLYDGGDWMSGALFQALATTHAAELQMMQEIGYDAITIGNHEFDWGPGVLADMVTRADELGVEVPIVAANIEPDEALRPHFDSGRIAPTLVVEAGRDLTIGVFGLIGTGAVSTIAVEDRVGFGDPLVAAEEAVAELEAEGVDLVVALTHAGVAEDLVLADEVAGIDVIVGGHSHTALTEKIVVGDTTIVQAGAYTKYLGEIGLQRTEAGWAVTTYQLHAMDDAVAGDPGVVERVDGFVAALDAGPLAALGTTFDEPMFTATADAGILRDGCDPSPVGTLVAEAYLDRVSALHPDDPIDVAFEAQGVIRDPILAGVQATSDVFRVLPLGGAGSDALGYPLVHFWLTGRDLRTACEITATVANDVSCALFLDVAGLRCTVDMERLPTFRATMAEVWDGTGFVEADDQALYHATVDSYSLGMLPLLEELSNGLIEFRPKDADGAEVTDPASLVVDEDPEAAGVQPYRTWKAVADYARTFSDTDADGIPDLPPIAAGESYLGWEYTGGELPEAR